MKNSLLISASLAILTLSACDNTKPPVVDGTTTTTTTGGTTDTTTSTSTDTTTGTSTSTSAATRPSNSLCNSNETVLFSCQMAKGNKVLSVCGSESLSGRESYVQYRYGSDPYTIDLSFPKDLSVSKRSFQYTSDGLSFNVSKNIRYQLYTQGSSAGVKTFWAKSPKKNRTLPCGGDVFNQLDKVTKVLN
ncbi:MAG: hypothetical protein KAG10_11360 [Methylococcales bacterium]|nr:hypothetical protein [Methylococcales bacterium]MCK5926486.1 hypothetical protein [Methylococcales bacterium]